MKKVIFALLLLVASVLLLINYLTLIGTDATDKITDNALRQLIASDSKPEQNQAKVAETKPMLVKQMTDTVMKQVTNNALEQVTKVETAIPIVNNAKAPIATIKIYDKKTAKEITIETQSLLEAQRQAITPQQQQEQQQKELKFKAYYQKPEKCLSPSNQETRIACGNEYMRAKAKFEALWQQGKFKN